MPDLASYSFGVYAMPTLVATTAALLLGIAVLARERVTFISVSFFLVTLTISTWLFSFTWIYAAADERIALWWSKMALVVVPFIASSAYQFTGAVLGIFDRDRKLAFAWWLIAALFATLAAGTDWLVDGVYRYTWGYYPRFATLSIALVAYVAAVLLTVFVQSAQAYRKTPKGTHKLRIKWFMLSFATGCLGAIDLLPAYGLEVYPIGYLPVVGFLIVSARTIWAYNLVDITPAYAARQIIDTMSDALVVLDREGRVRLVNRAACDLLGYTREELLGRTLSGTTKLMLFGQMDDLLRSGKVEHYEVPFFPRLWKRIRAPEGRILSISASTMRDKHNAPVGVVCIVRDITERKRQEEEIRALNQYLEQRVVERTAQLQAAKEVLEREISERKRAAEQLAHRAFYDLLTSLPNRALFMQRLREALLRAHEQPSYLFAVLFLDVDRFKNINDSLGHPIGDRLLVSTARRLEACLRSEDTVARLGGDEFAVLLDGIDHPSDATAVAERILLSLKSPLTLKGHEVFTSASIGIAFGSPSYGEPEELLRDADTAMYRAKALGRARFEVFDSAMHAHAMALMKMEAELRRAVERGEFCLHYQPIVSVRTGKIASMEALVRWQHPERGLVRPGEFIPLAEETGLVLQIDHFVLNEACRQIREWHDEFPTLEPLTISVNLSSAQLAQRDLPELLQGIVDRSDLETRHLRLEITEGALIHNPDHAAKVLSQLKELGLHLQIDDFGTGYSSLNYLQRYHFDALKIDRSFVSHMSPQGEDVEIVRTIITLAHNLRMEVVAEGVETVDQLAVLRQMRCEYAQGHLFSKPLDAEGARGLLAAQVQSPRPLWAPRILARNAPNGQSTTSRSRQRTTRLTDTGHLG